MEKWEEDGRRGGKRKGLHGAYLEVGYGRGREGKKMEGKRLEEKMGRKRRKIK